MKGTLKDRLQELDRLYPTWEKKTIWEYFLQTADRFPEQEFVVAQGRESYTYRQTVEESLRIAKGFLAAGVKPGDHVAVQMENSPEQIFTALAAAAVRAVKIPVNTALSAGELQFVLNQSEAKFLAADKLPETDLSQTGLKQVFCLSRLGGISGGRREGEPSRENGSALRGRGLGHHLHLREHQGSQGGRAHPRYAHAQRLCQLPQPGL